MFSPLDACGGLIEAVNGSITSPSFPDFYPPNKNCIWEVLAPPQWKITVNFTHFDIEGNNVSQNNYIGSSLGTNRKSELEKK